MSVRTLAFYACRDAPMRRDASAVFIPEAKRFAALHDGITIAIDNRLAPALRRLAVLDALRAWERRGLECVAFFCHGWASGLQLGFSLETIPELAFALRSALYSSQGTVPLYACSTGSLLRWAPPGGVRDGFAQRLRGALAVLGQDRVVVDSHRTAGHATRNPWVVRFDEESPRGSALVPTGSPAWRPWKRAIRGDGDMRFLFPLLERAGVYAAATTTA